ncbi:hypothetical protein MCEET85_00911 [Candidatus Methylopumilus planktonicus]|uniref:hypothetical protein n=1 Tax=Candidatus Methylopumilus planktonicus TaxID=1581557 RepID=UPI003BEF05EB
MLPKKRFYLALLYSYINPYHGSYIEVSDKMPIINELFSIKIFFYVPHKNSGARVTVLDLYNDLIITINNLRLPWEVIISEELPNIEVNYLICFKSFPKNSVPGNPKLIMLICDQAEIFWDHLPKFDYVVATSSKKFAKLLSLKNKKVFYISESETTSNLYEGLVNLQQAPSSRPPSLLWHGGSYSLEALYELRPVLEDFANFNEVNLIIISGADLACKYNWGKLKIDHLPWSIKAMLESAKKSKLGIIPARSSLRTNFLKPASRVRCLYSLGVPTIGDARVPDVREFMDKFSGPVAKNKDEWLNLIQVLWNSKKIDGFAKEGWKIVNNEFSTLNTAKQWINLFIQFEYEINLKELIIKK